MEDRELLELAAKAAGIDHRRLPDAWPERFDDDQWNPLIDDGDALRLAVKLRIDLDLWIRNDQVTAWNHLRGVFSLTEKPAPIVVAKHHEKRGDDEYAATRRAIVRAAAEIGKEPPC